ncbi:hypothetical protein [Streptococcus himalayensis]|uniref:Beta-1,6-galactofuranosyltransferase n=1 Tax=Streptococcus himalayensis TaxID=1888195 RepID=A0A917ECT2_9STRE|nr:hypothetical protein [Streptococcus himalayensis]GGE22935.1 beta-1,6-galactofuranosyltransferase [Streptococcus himalayensis]
MKYYLKEIIQNNFNERNAGSKARIDTDHILEALGYQPLESFLEIATSNSKLLKLTSQFYKYQELQTVFSEIQVGDEVVLQMPIQKQTLLLANCIRHLKKRNIKITILIHDLEAIRKMTMDSISFTTKIQISLSELKILKIADKVIAHNYRMKEKLVELGISEDKIVELEIFDYLLPEITKLKKAQKNNPIVIAGNLDPEKVGYIASLPQNIDYNLYGVGFTSDVKNPRINYFGSYLPNELPSHLEGSFGLVWDGDSATTCSGPFGNYLRYNNSHKASLYLASGLPLIVWEASALAAFVKRYHCGICVNSLTDIADELASLTDERFEILLQNTSHLGDLVKKGYFLTKSLDK